MREIVWRFRGKTSPISLLASRNPRTAVARQLPDLQFQTLPQPFQLRDLLAVAEVEASPAFAENESVRVVDDLAQRGAHQMRLAPFREKTIVRSARRCDMDDQTLSPSASNLDFQVLSDHALMRLSRRSADPAWKNATPLISKVAAAFLRLKGGSRTITAELAVPKEIAKAISGGAAKRAGSVVRSIKSGRVLKHLNEVKPSHVRKLLKSPMLAFVLMDAFQSALLNEKLAAIQLQLKEIDRKLEAQNQGPLRKAIEQMRDLPNLKGRNRWHLMHQIRNSLREFEGIYSGLCDSRWETIGHLLKSYEGARITNDDERKKLCIAAQEVTLDIEMIANAKILHARMTVELGEAHAAEQEVLRLQEFLLQQEERFQKVFGEEAPIQKLETHRRIMGRNLTAHSEARERLIEPAERIDHLLNSSLLLHLALPEKEDTTARSPS